MPALVRRGQSLFQPATVKILHVGPAAEAFLQIEGSTPQSVSLKPGSQLVEMLLSPVSSATTTTLQLRSGDEVMDERPLHREPVSRITVPATVTVEEAGPVVGTIKIESAAPGCTKLVRRVCIYDGLDRVDLFNDLDKKQELKPESVYFTFPLLIPDGQARIDVPFAVVRPEKDQLPGANRNYYCVQRWVDVSNADYGVTWITRDAPMLKFHPFKIIGRGRGCLPAASMMYDKTPNGVPEFWDREIEPASFFYSWVMTNHWETNYRAYQEGPHRFAYTLLPHGQYDQAAAQRGARNTTQPLLAFASDPTRPILKPALHVEGDGVLVTSLKPSRDGEALMVRVVAASGRPERFALKWAEPKRIYLSSPQESRGRRIEGPIDLPAHGIVTLRLEP